MLRQMSDRERRLWKLYGLTLDDYARLLENQGGCYICGKAPPPGKNLAVDHDHALVPKKKADRTPDAMRKTVRGLLCWLCNHRRIGRGATPEIMRSAATYLESAHALTQLCLAQP